MPAAANGPVPPQFHSRISRIALGDVIHRSALRFRARTALIEGEHRIKPEVREARNIGFLT